MRRVLHNLFIALTCLALLTACGSDNQGSATSGTGYTEPVIIGSTNFPEQLILANIYAEVLRARGVPVETRLNLGSREIVFPALAAGEIDILPEYTGALLSYLTEGESTVKKPQAVADALRKALPKDLVMLEISQAQDKDALVVTQKTARRYNLHTISDLEGIAGKLVIGGPPEMETRATGLPGLKRVYGLTFKDFRALDAGGPLTVAALESGAIDVARMFTTQGIIDAKGWVVLKDNKNLVAAQNIVPVVRREVLTADIRRALNAVSAALTTAGLQKLNRKVIVENISPEQVASHWVKAHGLAEAGSGR